MQFDLRLYLNKAWKVFAANFGTFLLMEGFAFVFFLAVYSFLIVCLAIVEVFLHVEDTEKASELFEVDKALLHPHFYRFIDLLFDFAFSVFFIFPAFTAAFFAILNSLRLSACAERFKAKRIVLKDTTQFLNPFSSRWPWRIATIIFIVRMVFGVWDYCIEHWLLPHSTGILHLARFLLVWIPFAYFALLCCFMVCYYLEWNDLSEWQALQRSVQLIFRYWQPLFWFIFLSATLLCFFIAIMISVPLILIAIAFAFEDTVGLHEEVKKADLQSVL